MSNNQILSKFRGQSPEVVVEPGEELLHKSYNFGSSASAVDVVVGIDGGSTQTRVSVVEVAEISDEEKLLDGLNMQYVLPSVSRTVPDDRPIRSKSPSLYDNMDTSLTDVSGKQDSVVKSVRLVRGTKSVNIEASENSLGSSTQKTADPSFYYNVVEGIGYAMLLKYKEAVPRTINVHLGVALPPDDTKSLNADYFRRNMVSFRWKHFQSGVSIDINIKTINIMTEPEAFIKSYYALSGQDIPQHTLHLEGGGRSIGAEILLNGKSLDTAQETLDFGGTQLLNAINDLYISKYGGAGLRRPVLEEAVRTGYARSGNSRLDISDLIVAAKKEMAQRIIVGITKQVFDKQSQVGPKDLNSVTVSGRLFDGGDYEMSIADELKEHFSKITPDTEFGRIEGNNIPAGLVLEVIMDNFVGEPVDETIELPETVQTVESELEAAEKEAETVLEVTETPSTELKH